MIGWSPSQLGIGGNIIFPPFVVLSAGFTLEFTGTQNTFPRFVWLEGKFSDSPKVFQQRKDLAGIYDLPFCEDCAYRLIY